MGQEVELSYSIWIQASADEVWKALTEPVLSSQYFPYALIEGVWSNGSAYAMRRRDGSVVYDGKVIVADRPHRLVQTCDIKAIPTFTGHEEFVLEWIIEQSGDASKLTIFHRGGEAAAQLIKMLVSHCPDTASGIKTLLETGKPGPADILEFKSRCPNALRGPSGPHIWRRTRLDRLDVGVTALKFWSGGGDTI